MALSALLLSAIGFRHVLPPGYRCIASRRKRVVAGVASLLEMGKKQSGDRPARRTAGTTTSASSIA
jgi:hypothetical protein